MEKVYFYFFFVVWKNSCVLGWTMAVSIHQTIYNSEELDSSHFASLLAVEKKSLFILLD